MRVTRRGSEAIWFAVLIVLGVDALAAQVHQQRLDDPEASFPDAFSTVGGLRELPDGRVMIADALGQVLLVVDMAAGRADTIGRTGQGPEEYRQPDGLFLLPGDSTLLVDLGNGRLTVLGPDLSLGKTTPIAQGSPGPGGGMLIRIPRGVDSRGRVYFQAMGMGRPGGGMPDSAAILRWDRSTGTVDTVGQVKLQDRTRSTRGGRNNQMVEIRPKPMTPQDGWAVAWDGRVALVRSIDYHVEWIHPDGRVVRGPANEYKAVRLRTAEKEAWIERSQSGALRIGVELVNGVATTSFSRGGGGRSNEPDLGSYEWPDVMPPFRASGVRVSPDGEMWVERYVAAGAAPTFDVFDGNGQLIKRVILPQSRRIVGFGKGAVYVTRVDEFDLLWLERYKL